MNGLIAHVVVDHGPFVLDVELSVKAGDTLAVVGPNGSGKTTLLRALAGLEPLSGGAITLNGTLLDHPTDYVFVPPEHRSVGIVFQDHRLFPTMNVVDNVAFGLRASKVHSATARDRAMHWLHTAGLQSRALDYPNQLSGGQAQRVALVRALAPEPDLLLLDEPLASADVSIRTEVRQWLRHYLSTFDGIRLLVTHDPLDAEALATHTLRLPSP